MDTVPSVAGTIALHAVGKVVQAQWGSHCLP